MIKIHELLTKKEDVMPQPHIYVACGLCLCVCEFQSRMYYLIFGIVIGSMVAKEVFGRPTAALTYL